MNPGKRRLGITITMPPFDSCYSYFTVQQSEADGDCNPWRNRGITIRCTRSRGPRGFFCLHDHRRGPVNVAVPHDFLSFFRCVKARRGSTWKCHRSRHSRTLASVAFLCALGTLYVAMRLHRERSSTRVKPRNSTRCLALGREKGDWQFRMRRAAHSSRERSEPTGLGVVRRRQRSSAPTRFRSGPAPATAQSNLIS